MSVRPGSGSRTLFKTFIAVAALGASGSQASVVRAIGVDAYIYINPLPLDLTEGPRIVSGPDTNARYDLLPLFDVWTRPVSGTTGIQAGNLVTPPGWSGMIPAGSAAPIQQTTTTTPHKRYSRHRPVIRSRAGAHTRSNKNLACPRGRRRHARDGREGADVAGAGR
jgi:Protein of unknown function (DUF1254)